MSKGPGIYHAMRWSYVLTSGRQGLTALITLILAKILGPHAFGVMAMAMVYIGLIQVVLEQGLIAAIIQRKDLKPGHLNSVFWATCVLSILLVAGSVSCSGWWAAQNGTPELAGVLDWLSIIILTTGLSTVPESLLQREMKFKLLAQRAGISVFMGGIVGVGMALAGFGVWSLVGQQLCTAVLQLVLIWRLGSWRPTRSFSWAMLWEVVSFSAWVLLSRIGVFIRQQADVLLMGLYFTTVAVGLYRLADRLVETVVKMNARSLQMVALPHFSRLQDQPEKLAEEFKRCLRISALLNVPAMGCLAAIAEPLMGLLGEQWVAAAAAMWILCWVGVARALMLIADPLVMGAGKPAYGAVNIWLTAVLGTLGFLAVATLLTDAPVKTQIVAIAMVRAVSMLLVSLPLSVGIAMYLVGVRAPEVLRLLAPPVAGAIAAFVVGWAAVQGVAHLVSHDLFKLVAGATSGGVAAVGIMLWLDSHFAADLRQVWLFASTKLVSRGKSDQTSG